MLLSDFIGGHNVTFNTITWRNLPYYSRGLYTNTHTQSNASNIHDNAVLTESLFYIMHDVYSSGDMASSDTHYIRTTLKCV